MPETLYQYKKHVLLVVSLQGRCILYSTNLRCLASHQYFCPS